MSRVLGGVLAVTGVVACPCHLPITLPLVLGILGGTGVGTFIGANQGLIYGIFTAYFIGGLGVGIYLLNRKKLAAQGAACELPSETRRPKNGHRKQTRAVRRRAKV